MKLYKFKFNPSPLFLFFKHGVKALVFMASGLYLLGLSMLTYKALSVGYYDYRGSPIWHVDEFLIYEFYFIIVLGLALIILSVINYLRLYKNYKEVKKK